MKCKFCRQKKVLIKSHIIPFSFHKLMAEAGVPRLHSRTGTPKTSKRSPGGLYDNELVCKECEGQFSLYDDYAKRFFLDDFGKHREDSPEFEGKWIIVKMFDYAKLKLFFLSLLWRASATKQPFFNKVSVGPFETKLKEMIKNGDPGRPSEFPVMLRKFKEDWSEKGSIQPTRFRDDNGRTCYHFFFASYCARIKVDTQKYPTTYDQIILKKTAPWFIAQQEMTDCHEFKKFMKDYSKNFYNSNIWGPSDWQYKVLKQ